MPESKILGLDSQLISFFCLDHAGLSFHHSELKETSAVNESPELPRMLVSEPHSLSNAALFPAQPHLSGGEKGREQKTRSGLGFALLGEIPA